MYVADRSDLINSDIVFLLEIIWGGEVYRFSTYPITLTKEDSSTVHFQGGLSDPDYEQKLSTISEDPETDAISLEAYFDIDLVEQLFKYGQSLETATGELSYVLIRQKKPIATYEKRIRLFSGDVIQPIIGDPERDRGWAAFSIERNPAFSGNPLLNPFDRIDDTFVINGFYGAIPYNFNTKNKMWPLIIGQPGKNITVRNQIIAAPQNVDRHATPAYLVKVDASGATSNFALDATCTIIIAAGHVEATTVSVMDYGGNIASNKAVQLFTLTDGRKYSCITVKYSTVTSPTQFPGTIVDGILHPVLRDGFAEFPMAATDKPKYWIKWENGGGMPNPYGEGLFNSAGDIIRHGLLETGVKVDLSSWLSVIPLLNEYKFSGYIIDPDLTWWDWILDNVLPFVPLDVVNGADGLRPVLSLLYHSNYLHPKAHITEGAGFYVETPLESITELSDIINSISLKYAFVPANEGYWGAVRIGNDAQGEQIGFDIQNQYSLISKTRYGTHHREVELRYVYDLETAIKIGFYLIRSKALTQFLLEVNADTEYGFINVGDIIAFSSTSYFMDSAKLQVTGKSWQDGVWKFTLMLENNPLLNQRV